MTYVWFMVDITMVSMGFAKPGGERSCTFLVGIFFYHLWRIWAVGLTTFSDLFALKNGHPLQARRKGSMARFSNWASTSKLVISIFHDWKSGISDQNSGALILWHTDIWGLRCFKSILLVLKQCTASTPWIASSCESRDRAKNRMAWPAQIWII